MSCELEPSADLAALDESIKTLYRQEKTYQEIADATGVPFLRVKKRITIMLKWGEITPNHPTRACKEHRPVKRGDA